MPNEEFSVRPGVLTAMAAQYDDIVHRIDGQVRQVIDLVTRHNPVSLLMLCHHHFLRAQSGTRRESEMGEEQNIAMHLPTYLQSLIVSNPQRGDTDISPEGFKTLVTAVEELYREIMLPYLFAAEGKRQIEQNRGRNHIDRAVMEHHFRWLAIRSDRHIKHDFDFLNDFLSGHTGAIQRKFGLSSEDIVSGLRKMYQTFSGSVLQILESQRELMAEWNDLHNSIVEENRATQQPLDEEELRDKLRQTFADAGFRERFNALVQQNFDGSLFDVLSVTGWPETFVAALAFSPGEDTEFMTGEQAGWPNRFLPIMKKPFLNWKGRYYFFDVHTLFDYIVHNIRDAVTAGDSQAADKWQKRHGKNAERVTLNLLGDLLPHAVKVGAYHYDYLSDDGEIANAEGDGLFLYARHLILAEVKGGRISHRAPDGRPGTYLSGVRDLLNDPVAQAERFLKELERAGSVTLKDKEGQTLLTLSITDFDHHYIVTTTLEHLGEYTANVEGATALGVAQKNLPVFSIQLDDLRVIRDLLDTPAEFLHFLDERMKAHTVPEFATTDEMEHFALYLNNSQYTNRRKATPDATHIKFIGIKDDIDAYFHRLWLEEAPNPKPKLTLPARYGELVIALYASGDAIQVRAAKYLLDLNQQARDDIASTMGRMLESQRRDSLVKPLHIDGERPFTLLAFTLGLPRPDWESARRYSLAAMKVRRDPECPVIRVFFDEHDKIASTDVTFLTQKDIEDEPEGSLDTFVEQFRETLLRHTGRQRKIRPNEPCPCGSGEKYKKCHGRPGQATPSRRN